MMLYPRHSLPTTDRWLRKRPSVKAAFKSRDNKSLMGDHGESQPVRRGKGKKTMRRSTARKETALAF